MGTKHSWITLSVLALGLAMATVACSTKKNTPASPAGPADTSTPTATYTQATLKTNTPTPSASITQTPVWTLTWTPTSTDTLTPSSPTDTPTPTPTSTVTLTRTASLTPTATTTWTPTPTGTWMTPTATATGCGKSGGSAETLPVNPVSGGTTVVGLPFNIGLCCTISCSGGVYPVYTSFNFSTSVTGNLATEILQAQLWSGGTLLGTSPYSGGSLSFSGFSSATGNYTLEYVLSPGATGVIDTAIPFMNGFGGYLSPDHGSIWPEPYYFNVDSGPLTVINQTPTPTATP